jgi:hypothetical protein
MQVSDPLMCLICVFYVKFVRFNLNISLIHCICNFSTDYTKPVHMFMIIIVHTEYFMCLASVAHLPGILSLHILSHILVYIFMKT